jgi:hypothetical protein
MERHGFDVGAGGVALAVKFFSLENAARLSGNFFLRFAKRSNADAQTDKLLRIRNGKNFREPSIEQRFNVRALGKNFAFDARFDFFRRARNGTQGECRVFEQLGESGAVSQKSHICWMLNDFEAGRHVRNSSALIGQAAAVLRMPVNRVIHMKNAVRCTHRTARSCQALLVTANTRFHGLPRVIIP